MKKIFIHFSLFLVPFFGLFKHFELSIQFLTDLCEWFEFSFRYIEKCDHAGLYFTCSFFKLFFIEWSVYDTRHWDAKKDCFLSTAVQYSAACDLQFCKFNGFNSEFLWDEAKSCLEDAKSMQEFVRQNFASYRKHPDDNGGEFVHAKVGEHFEEIDRGLSEMIEWLEKLLGR